MRAVLLCLILCTGCTKGNTAINHSEAWELNSKPAWVDNLFSYQQRYPDKVFIVSGSTRGNMGALMITAQNNARIQQPRSVVGDVMLSDMYIVHDGTTYSGLFLYEFLYKR